MMDPKTPRKAKLTDPTMMPTPPSNTIPTPIEAIPKHFGDRGEQSDRGPSLGSNIASSDEEDGVEGYSCGDYEGPESHDNDAVIGEATAHHNGGYTTSVDAHFSGCVR